MANGILWRLLIFFSLHPTKTDIELEDCVSRNCTRQSPQPIFKAKELKVYFVIIHCCAYDIHCVAVSTEKRDKQIISLAQ